MDSNAFPISLPSALVQRIEALAQHLDRAPQHVIEVALEAFIQRHEDACNPPVEQAIHQGDLFWIHPQTSFVSELGSYTHPYVVIQDDILNASRIKTVVVCALTTNLKQSKLPGNVLLDVGEGGLPKHSVIEVSKVSTVDKTALGAYVGTLDPQRVRQILTGMRFLQRSFFVR